MLPILPPTTSVRRSAVSPLPPTAAVSALPDQPHAPKCPRIPQVDTSDVPTSRIISTYPHSVQTALAVRLTARPNAPWRRRFKLCASVDRNGAPGIGAWRVQTEKHADPSTRPVKSRDMPYILSLDILYILGVEAFWAPALTIVERWSSQIDFAEQCRAVIDHHTSSIAPLGPIPR